MIKNKVIQVRLSEENVIGITAKTRLMGLSNSAWVRMIILRELNEEEVEETFTNDVGEFKIGLTAEEFSEEMIDGSKAVTNYKSVPKWKVDAENRHKNK